MIRKLGLVALTAGALVLSPRLLWGEEDRIMPRSYADKFANGIAGQTEIHGGERAFAKGTRVGAGGLEGARHGTLLVVDATTGRNGLQQARLFGETVGVAGVALTKLDGSAKGGVAIPIAYELGLPVKLIGVGEGIDDLRPFDPQDFARALVEQAENGCLVAVSLDLPVDYTRGVAGAKPYPLWIKPDRKLSVQDVMALMRDHYEGTPLDMTAGLDAGPFGSPLRCRPMTFKVDGQTYSWERPISTQQTGASFVAHSRAFLPDAVGGVLWYGVDDTYTSCYFPLYAGIADVPPSFARGTLKHFDWDDAWWVFNLVANYAQLKYSYMVKDIVKVQGEVEGNFFALEPAIEKTAALRAAPARRPGLRRHCIAGARLAPRRRWRAAPPPPARGRRPPASPQRGRQRRRPGGLRLSRAVGEQVPGQQVLARAGEEPPRRGQARLRRTSGDLPSLYRTARASGDLHGAQRRHDGDLHRGRAL